MSHFEDAHDLQEIFGRPGTGPLAGVVVADLSRVLAGPYCTMLLADMGATVIKIESTAGDDARAWVPPHRDGESTFFLSVNRNKHSIALDFSDPEQLAVVERIIARADILVENFKPGGLVRYGLDYESVSA
ncbi:CoA transferase, partial [Streptomyces sp.]